MVLLHRRCRAHHVRGCGPGPVPGQAARAGAGVAFVQAIFLPHDENCFALYQARSTSGVTAAGPLARLRFDQVTTRSSATRQADSRPARGRATFVTSGRRHHLPDPAGPPAWHGSTQTGQPASPRASAAWLALHRRPVPIPAEPAAGSQHAGRRHRDEPHLLGTRSELRQVRRHCHHQRKLPGRPAGIRTVTALAAVSGGRTLPASSPRR